MAAAKYWVNFRYEGESHPLEVHKGVSEADFTYQCIAAFSNLPYSARIVGVRDATAVYDLSLLSTFPREFANGEYDIVVDPNSLSGPTPMEVGDTEDEPEFVLFFDNEDLGLTAADSWRLAALVTRTNLVSTEYEDAVDIFRVACAETPGLVTRSSLQTALAELIASAKDRAPFVPVFDALFNLTDRLNTGAVDFAEFVAAFSLFCAGSKSEKLALAFRLFDTNGDNLLTRRQLWRFLRSFLTALFTLSSASAGELKDTLYRGIDDSTVLAAQKVFAQYATARGGSQDRQLVSFDGFGWWYNTTGFQVLPWLELLDLSKWPNGDAVDAGLPSSGAGAAATASSSAASDDGAQVLLEFTLAEGIPLRLTAADVATYNALLSATRLYTMDPQDLLAMLTPAAQDGLLNEADFNASLSSLLLPLPSDTRDAVTEGLMSLFRSFDPEGTGTVDAASFLAGMLMLTAGGKSTKLALAFQLFDENANGSIMRRDLWKFLQSFLTVLVALSSQHRDDPADVSLTAKTGAVEACAYVFLESKREEEDSISFEEFGVWYNEGGFELVPWIELLDHAKWPDVPRADADGSQQQSEDEDAEADADVPMDGEQDDEDDDDAVVFRFQLTDSSSDPNLELSKADVSALHRIVDSAALDTIACGDIKSAFEKRASNGLLDKRNFNQALMDLVDWSTLSRQDRGFLALALSNIFGAFDRDSKGDVDVDEFVAGFSLLAGGSKSEKLEMAFTMFDEDGDGLLTRREMWQYLRAYLTILMALNAQSQSMAAADVVDLVDRAAVTLTQCIFSDADTNRDSRISYVEFGNWYNTNGFRVLPWLELLDTRKWPRVQSGRFGPAGGDKDDQSQSASDAAEDDDDDQDDEDDDEDQDGEDDSIVFEFHSMDGDVMVVIDRDDVERLFEITKAGMFHLVDAASLYQAFGQVLKASDSISTRMYRHVLRQLLQPRSSVPREQMILSQALDRIFQQFWAFTPSAGGAPADQLIAGLSLLTTGSKSEKLALAWGAFDRAGSGLLDARQVQRFLSAFLGMLSALSGDAAELEAEYIVSMLTEPVAQLQAAIFQDADADHDGQISYEEFGRWYNSGGFGYLPWLELLDLRKWPSAESSAASPTESAQQAAPAATSAAAPAGGEANILFEFPLDSALSLPITSQDCERLNRLVSLSGLARIEPARFHELFAARSRAGSLVERAFEDVMRNTISTANMSEASRTFLSVTLSQFFWCFDRGSAGSVDFDEFASGFSLLATGSKSDKLSLAFLLFDEDKDGYLSRRELCKYLRAFLCALAALSESMLLENPMARNAALNTAAWSMADHVFATAARRQQAGISYEEFGQWYNTGGYTRLPWLELLDLSKWPVVGRRTAWGETSTRKDASTSPNYDQDDEDETDSDYNPDEDDQDENDDDDDDDNVTSSADDDDDDDDDDEDDDDDDDDDDDGGQGSVLFELELAPGAEPLQVMAEHAFTFHKMLSLCQWQDLSAEQLFQEFTGAAADGTSMDRAQFDQVVETLIPNTDTYSDEEQYFLYVGLSTLFRSYARAQADTVDAVDLAAGLSLFVSGSKSEKLAAAFTYMDRDSDGYLSEGQLAGFLRSFLTILATLSQQGGALTEVEMADMLTSVCRYVARSICSEATLARPGHISYEEFGNWYNVGGFELVPWIELLDAAKWPSMEEVLRARERDTNVDVSRNAAAAQSDSDDVDEDEEDDQVEDEEDDDAQGTGAQSEEDVVFSFSLSQGVELTITVADCLTLDRFKARSGLTGADAPSVFRVFTEAADDQGLLSEGAFRECVRSLIPGKNLSAVDMRFLSVFLWSMFSVFRDQDGDSAIAQEIALGFTVLAAGSKSVKLGIPFQTLGTDATVNEEQLARFLRSYLFVLVALVDLRTRTATTTMRAPVIEACEEFAESIVQRVAATNGRVTYEQFAAWYNDGGFDQLPWLELLDMSKWPSGAALMEGQQDEDDDDAEDDQEPDAAVGAPPSSQSDDSDFKSESSPQSGTQRSPEPVPSDPSDPDASRSPPHGRKYSWTFTSGLPNLGKLHEHAPFLTVDPQLLHEAFNAEAHDQTLDKEGFDRCIARLVPGLQALPEGSREYVDMALANIFYAFDRDGSGVVNFDEFASGFSLLVGGTQSDKMTTAFALFDEDGDGFISQHEMWKYLRAFLTVAMVLKHPEAMARTAPMSERRRMHTLIDRFAVEAASKVFKAADTNDDGRISMDEFAAWFQAGGDKDVPWMNLLEAAVSSTHHQDRADAPTHAPIGPDFRLVLHSGSSDLVVNYEDAQMLDMLRHETGLSTVRPSRAREVLALIVRRTEGSVNKANFQTVMSRLVANTPEDSKLHTRGVDVLFDALDAHHSGTVSNSDLLVALCVLVGSTSEDRLTTALSGEDEDNDGLLSRRELYNVFHVFATVLVALRSIRSAVKGGCDPVEFTSAVRAAIRKIATQAMEAFFNTHRDGTGSVPVVAVHSWVTHDLASADKSHPAKWIWTLMCWMS